MVVNVTEYQDRLTSAIEKATEKIKDLSPFFKKYLSLYQTDLANNWELEGPLMGKKWKALNPNYKKWKLMHGYPENKLIKTGALYQDIVEGKGINVITKDNMEYGTKLPYAPVHQYGFKAIPARPYLFTIKGDFPTRSKQAFKNMLTEYIESGGK
jgi:phage gpG-like protein